MHPTKVNKFLALFSDSKDTSAINVINRWKCIYFDGWDTSVNDVFLKIDFEAVSKNFELLFRKAQILKVTFPLNNTAVHCRESIVLYTFVHICSNLWRETATHKLPKQSKCNSKTWLRVSVPCFIIQNYMYWKLDLSITFEYSKKTNVIPLGAL